MGETAKAVFELPHDRVECDVDAPCLLTDAAAGAGIILNVACGGNGTCGGCAVDLLEGRFAGPDGQAIELSAGQPRRVLACRTRALGGAFAVRVPRHSLVEAGEQIVMDFEHAPAHQVLPAARKLFLKLPPPTLGDQRGDLERVADAVLRSGADGPVLASLAVARSAGPAGRCGYELTATVTRDGGADHLVRLEPGDTTGRHYGVAADVGTTTVVVALVDLNTGGVVDAASSYNRQVTRCDDVASRISYAAGSGRVEELRELIVARTVNPLLRLLQHRHGLGPDDLAHMVVAGNTVMTHLFCGLDPAGLGGVPFAPVTNFPGPFRASALGLEMNGDALVDVFPSAAAYVGGDITADMYLCGIAHRDGVNVLIDIGTNAEIVVGNRQRLVACAAPAGPAFEGHGLRCGMRAAVGAIDSVSLGSAGEPPRYTVIGDGSAPPGAGGPRPAGVCGSGLIDFVAQAFAAGLLTPPGRFDPDAARSSGRLRKAPHANGQVPAYELVGAEDTDDRLAPILIAESDVAPLLQAKGVIFAALQIALKQYGARFEDVQRFYLAGGFARHIDLDNAVTMGLLPDIDRGRYVFLGNGSLGGAFLALVDARVRRDLPALAAAPEVIELNLDPDFMDAYTDAMFLPNADASLFPPRR